MTLRNPTGRRLAGRLSEIQGSAGRIPVHAIALTALGVVGLMKEPTATAAYAVAAVFGGLLLIRAVAVRRVVELRRVRVHPVRHR